VIVLDIIGVVAAVLGVVYLVYAIVKPENF